MINAKNLLPTHIVDKNSKLLVMFGYQFNDPNIMQGGSVPSK